MEVACAKNFNKCLKTEKRKSSPSDLKPYFDPAGQLFNFSIFRHFFGLLTPTWISPNDGHATRPPAGTTLASPRPRRFDITKKAGYIARCCRVLMDWYYESGRFDAEMGATCFVPHEWMTWIEGGGGGGGGGGSVFCCHMHPAAAATVIVL